MKAPTSLLVCLILLTASLGVWGRQREDKDESDDDNEGTTEGDIVITTSRNESHASASAFASAGGASVTANAETTFSSLTSINGEPEDDDSDDSDDDDEPKSKRKSKSRRRSRDEESDVSERVRDAILNANVDRVASLLSRMNDTDLLGHGFTYPADLRDENLIFSKNRTMDPDVVALKGMAKAALEGDLSEKLTEVFIAAVYGPDFDDNLCFKAPKYTHSTHSRVETQNRTVITTGYRQITNETGTFRIDNDPEVLNSVSEDTLFEETNVDFRETERSNAEEDEDEDEDEVCYTKKEIKTIRRNLRQDFRDVDLMTSIVEDTPREVSRKQRSLLDVETPVETWLCSACWKKKFCNKNVYWCPE